LGSIADWHLEEGLEIVQRSAFGVQRSAGAGNFRCPFLIKRRQHPTAVECKWSADGFQIRNLEAFRRQHPRGQNVVVATDIDSPFTRIHGSLKVRFESLAGFVASL
jgi:hypothetical protein